MGRTDRVLRSVEKELLQTVAARLVRTDPECFAAGPDKLRRWLSIKEYASLYDVSVSTVRNWIRGGAVVAKQPFGKNGTIRIPSDQKVPAGQWPKETFKAGCVYLIRYKDHYKIGTSRSLKSRFSGLSAGLPDRPELVTVIPSERFLELEKELHGMFADKRSNREWFFLTVDDVEYIKNIEGALVGDKIKGFVYAQNGTH